MSKLFFFVFCLIGAFVQSQHTGLVEGTIHAEDGNPLAYATVVVKGTQYGTLTNEDGYYTFTLPEGEYTIAVSFVGYSNASKKIKVGAKDSAVQVNFRLAENTENLDEVTVRGKTKAERIETEGFAVDVVETQEMGLRSLQTNELLDRTVGVRIRQNGGMGSSVNYNINGMSGNAVRIFIDGIPIATYGSSFNLNSIPPSMIERIEVYKGVVPGHLSDDALGGAINVVLKEGAINNINASISHGSFNTTQANFNGLYRFDTSGFTIKASGFWNYSDNDYEVWGDKVYNILPDGRYEYVRAKRFNDAYRSVGVVIEAGFTDVSWADDFFVGFTHSDSYKEVQHGAFMTIPYEGRFLESDAGIFHLTYRKKDLFVKGLDVNVHGVYGERNRMVNDTVKWNYNWNGEISLDLDGDPIARPQGAQQGAPTMAHINRKVSSVRYGVSYSINPTNKLLLNHMFQLIDREDDDQMRSVLERNFLGTRYLNKNIISLSYELLAFKNTMKATLFGKYYHQRMERMNPEVEVVDGEETRVEDIINSTRDALGYGTAISYAILPEVTLLASAERAVRLPTENEIFGDVGDNIAENPNIQPETSNNFNLGARLGAFQKNKHQASLAGNFFYRNIQDRIGTQVQTRLNVNVQTLPYVNQGDVNSTGFDVECSYTYNNNLNVMMSTSKFNLTYQNLYNKRKLPNEPMFTANASAQYSLHNVFTKKSKLNLFYNFLFVDKFSYILVPYGNNSGLERFETPQQFIHDLGVSYVFPNKKWIVSLDAKNILDKQAFDNFAVQKPGRAFYAKINYVLNNF